MKLILICAMSFLFLPVASFAQEAPSDGSTGCNDAGVRGDEGVDGRTNANMSCLSPSINCGSAVDGNLCKYENTSEAPSGDSGGAAGTDGG